MKHKKQEKTELTDFNELLDTLLPQKNELLCAALKKMKENLHDTLIKKKGQSDYSLELEKEKNNCLQELLQIIIDQYQRVGADYANFQKRVPKQTADAVCYEKEKIIKTLLPALDNFEHTLQNARSAEDVGVFVEGIRIIYDQILDILKSHGAEQIKAVGEKFDPALHQAMLQKADQQQRENIVLEEFQTGYKLNGRVIRPSKVIVNKLQYDADSQKTTKDETTDTEL